MFAVYVTVTLAASVVNGLAAIANFTGHHYAVGQADNLRVPRSWMPWLGTLLAAGAVGLLAGSVVPLLGRLAAGGLVLYFIGAFVAHVRVRDTNYGPWAGFFTLAVAALAVNLAYAGPAVTP